MSPTWSPEVPGVLRLPSGALVRGRGLRAGRPVGPAATWSVRLGARPPVDLGAHVRWIRWHDFALPARPEEALDVLQDALSRAATQRVEVCCAGGVGRTGTALAALCVLQGSSPGSAVRRVRDDYHPRAVEVPWQRLFLHRAAVRRDP